MFHASLKLEKVHADSCPFPSFPPGLQNSPLLEKYRERFMAQVREVPAVRLPEACVEEPVLRDASEDESCF